MRLRLRVGIAGDDGGRRRLPARLVLVDAERRQVGRHGNENDGEQEPDRAANERHAEPGVARRQDRRGAPRHGERQPGGLQTVARSLRGDWSEELPWT